MLHLPPLTGRSAARKAGEGMAGEKRREGEGREGRDRGSAVPRTMATGCGRTMGPWDHGTIRTVLYYTALSCAVHGTRRASQYCTALHCILRITAMLPTVCSALHAFLQFLANGASLDFAPPFSSSCRQIATHPPLWLVNRQSTIVVCESIQ
jgi:hypothetical protein